jgi:hypothetical protein
MRVTVRAKDKDKGERRVSREAQGYDYGKG